MFSSALSDVLIDIPTDIELDILFDWIMPHELIRLGLSSQYFFLKYILNTAKFSDAYKAKNSLTLRRGVPLPLPIWHLLLDVSNNDLLANSSTFANNPCERIHYPGLDQAGRDALDELLELYINTGKNSSNPEWNWWKVAPNFYEIFFSADFIKEKLYGVKSLISGEGKIVTIREARERREHDSFLLQDLNLIAKYLPERIDFLELNPDARGEDLDNFLSELEGFQEIVAFFTALQSYAQESFQHLFENSYCIVNYAKHLKLPIKVLLELSQENRGSLTRGNFLKAEYIGDGHDNWKVARFFASHPENFSILVNERRQDWFLFIVDNFEILILKNYIENAYGIDIWGQLSEEAKSILQETLSYCEVPDEEFGEGYVIPPAIDLLIQNILEKDKEESSIIRHPKSLLATKTWEICELLNKGKITLQDFYNFNPSARFRLLENIEPVLRLIKTAGFELDFLARLPLDRMEYKATFDTIAKYWQHLNCCQLDIGIWVEHIYMIATVLIEEENEGQEQFVEKVEIICHFLANIKLSVEDFLKNKDRDISEYKRMAKIISHHSTIFMLTHKFYISEEIVFHLNISYLDFFEKYLADEKNYKKFKWIIGHIHTSWREFFSLSIEDAQVFLQKPKNTLKKFNNDRLTYYKKKIGGLSIFSGDVGQEKIDALVGLISQDFIRIENLSQIDPEKTTTRILRYTNEIAELMRKSHVSFEQLMELKDSVFTLMVTQHQNFILLTLTYKISSKNLLDLAREKEEKFRVIVTHAQKMRKLFLGNLLSWSSLLALASKKISFLLDNDANIDDELIEKFLEKCDLSELVNIKLEELHALFKIDDGLLFHLLDDFELSLIDILQVFSNKREVKLLDGFFWILNEFFPGVIFNFNILVEKIDNDVLKLCAESSFQDNLRFLFEQGLISIGFFFLPFYILSRVLNLDAFNHTKKILLDKNFSLKIFTSLDEYELDILYDADATAETIKQFFAEQKAEPEKLLKARLERKQEIQKIKALAVFADTELGMTLYRSEVEVSCTWSESMITLYTRPQWTDSEGDCCNLTKRATVP